MKNSATLVYVEMCPLYLVFVAGEETKLLKCQIVRGDSSLAVRLSVKCRNMFFIFTVFFFVCFLQTVKVKAMH